MANMLELVCDSLESFLHSIDRTPPPIDAGTKPIPDLGLDTEDEVEWLCDLEEKGLHIPHKFRAFVADDGTRMRSIGEIARLLEQCQTSNVKAD